MPESIQSVLERKRARRRELAALPVGEKLRMLEEMVRDLRHLAIAPPPKPERPVTRRVRTAE